jgi:hypothetical protein
MQQPILSCDTHFHLNPDIDSFPFVSKLSLGPLIAFWQQAIPSHHPVFGTLATKVQKALQQAPELLEPFEDFSVITQHRELVDALMTVVFPAAFWDEVYGATLLPFRLRSFYATPSFERLLMADDGSLRGRVNVDAQTVAQVKILHAYAFVLCQVYGIALDFEYPLIFTATDPDTGLDRHFKMHFDGRFMEIETVGEVPPLTDDVHKHLMGSLGDPDSLMELLPPEHFVIHGFAVLNAVEVTDQEVLSSLKRDLIDKESIVSKVRFRTLQDKLRTLFRKPDLLFGLAGCRKGQVFLLNSGSNIEYG